MVGEDSCQRGGGAAGPENDVTLSAEKGPKLVVSLDPFIVPAAPVPRSYSVAVVSSKTGFTGGMIGSSGYPMTASTMR